MFFQHSAQMDQVSLIDKSPAVNAQPSPHDTSPLHICQCRQCVCEQEMDSNFPESHDVRPGCWLNATMYYRHKREETLLRELDHANLDKNGQPIDEVLLQNSPHGLASPVELTLTGNHVTTADTKAIIRDQSQHPSIADLDHLRSRINRYVYSLSLKGPLKFAGHPTIDGPYIRLDHDDLLAVNSGLHALDPRHPLNQSLLAFQNNLTMSMKEALEIETHRVGKITEEKDALIKRIVRELDRIDDFKEKEWERQRKGDNDEDSDTYVNTGRFSTQSIF
jgi:hypothetical protein